MPNKNGAYIYTTYLALRYFRICTQQRSWYHLIVDVNNLVCLFCLTYLVPGFNFALNFVAHNNIQALLLAELIKNKIKMFLALR
jgi:hypothetical protein